MKNLRVVKVKDKYRIEYDNNKKTYYLGFQLATKLNIDLNKMIDYLEKNFNAKFIKTSDGTIFEFDTIQQTKDVIEWIDSAIIMRKIIET